MAMKVTRQYTTQSIQGSYELPVQNNMYKKDFLETACHFWYFDPSEMSFLNDSDKNLRTYPHPEPFDKILILFKFAAEKVGNRPTNQLNTF